MTISEDLDLGGAEVSRESLLLAHDHAVPISPWGEVPCLYESGHGSVLHRAEPDVVEAAAEEVPQGRGDRGWLLIEHMGEEIEVVNAVRLGHAHVRPRALEAREAPGGVAHGTRAAAAEALAHEHAHGVKAEDVANLEQAPRRAGDLGQAPALGHRERHGLLHETVLARAEAFAGEREMAVRRRDEIDGVHVRQSEAEVRHGLRRGNTGLDREGPALLGHVGHPDLTAELAEHSEVLLPPASQTDEQHFHGRVLPSPPTSSAIS